jgi:Ca2+-transporting ATPase
VGAPGREAATATGIAATGPWHEPAAAVLGRLGTDPGAGLATADATRRLEEVGPNELVEERRPGAWRILARQAANTMTGVLAVAALVSVLIGDPKDAVVIGVIVALNVGVGFAQEYRAERAMGALKGMTAPLARVVGDGASRTIPAHDLVPGDLLQLEAGDVVPADARLVEAPNLRVNEAPLTGESVPVDKTVDSLPPGVGELVALARTPPPRSPCRPGETPAAAASQ